MKKSMVTIMFSGLILLFPKYAFTSAIFSINNLSTIESVVLYHNNSGGSGWYHCPYGTGNGLGPDKYVIPPMSNLEISFNANYTKGWYLAQNVQMWAQLPDALLPISPIYQWQSEAMLYLDCIQGVGFGGFCGSQPDVYNDKFISQNIFANSGFYTNNIPVHWVSGHAVDGGSVNYISSFCPTIQDANNMLQNYATDTCPIITNYQTFVDPQWRQWSIRCSNSEIEPVTSFGEAFISVYPYNGAHAEEIDCHYVGSNNFNVTFTNLNSHVLLPVNGQSNWLAQTGTDHVSGAATCDNESDGGQQCQWAYAQESY